MVRTNISSTLFYKNRVRVDCWCSNNVVKVSGTKKWQYFLTCSFTIHMMGTEKCEPVYCLDFYHRIYQSTGQPDDYISHRVCQSNRQ